MDYEELVELHGSPLLVLDCAEIAVRYRELNAALPGVRLHYAMKALPHAAVVATLNGLGSAFDLASRGEIPLLEEARVNPRNVIHTHPIKKDAEIRAALRYGCTTFVVDNLRELEKFSRYRHRVGLLVRVAVPDAGARVNLSRKFGCRAEEVPGLLSRGSGAGNTGKGN